MKKVASIRVPIANSVIGDKEMALLQKFIGQEITVVETFQGRRSKEKGRLIAVDPFGSIDLKLEVGCASIPLIGIYRAVVKIWAGRRCIYFNPTLFENYPEPRCAATHYFQRMLSFGKNAGIPRFD